MSGTTDVAGYVAALVDVAKSARMLLDSLDRLTRDGTETVTLRPDYSPLVAHLRSNLDRLKESPHA